MQCSHISLLLAVYALVVIGLSAAKDYYDILGVKKTASKRDIKRAFRQLALRYHPDKNQNDKDAEKKFIEITKAYEVLSNPDEREKYDRFGESVFGQDGGSNGGRYDNFKFNDFFSGFDSAFHAHTHGQRAGNGGAHFHFSGGNAFNFDDLFDDSDNDDAGFGFGDSFGNMGGFHNMFDEFDSLHDSHARMQDSHARMQESHARMHQRAQQRAHEHIHRHTHQQAGPNVHHMHQHAHTETSNGHTTHHHTVHTTGPDGQTTHQHSHTGGQRCRTVTTRVGDVVTTRTTCS